MKRLLGLLLVMGMVGCGGSVAELEKLGAKITKDDQGQVIRVNLYATRITDAGLVHLKGLTNLQHLSLDATKVTDAGLGHLKEMNLHTLKIPQHAKTDIGLKNYLRAVEPATELTLFDWQVTDAGLMHLKGLTSLQKLEIRKTSVTPLGVAELLRVLPNCIIDFAKRSPWQSLAATAEKPAMAWGAPADLTLLVTKKIAGAGKKVAATREIARLRSEIAQALASAGRFKQAIQVARVTTPPFMFQVE